MTDKSPETLDTSFSAVAIETAKRKSFGSQPGRHDAAQQIIQEYLVKFTRISTI